MAMASAALHRTNLVQIQSTLSFFIINHNYFASGSGLVFRSTEEMDGGGVGVGVGGDAKAMKVEAPVTRPDQGFNLEPDVSVSSPVTRQKAAAAKQLIENHYKNYLQGLQDRKERRRALQRRAAEAQVSSEEEEQMLRNLEKKETEYMRLQRHKIGIDDFELLTLIGKGAFGEVRLCRAKTSGEVFAMKKLKKSEMLSRGQVPNRSHFQ
ncbi:Protein kinase, ATP binding site-containing protein [Cynara cardunculus var. scolymus]|uniref:non-specific serine/threonine protein kinase n=1 Tax=Cynara cardunculus var. scolymus TaxID=59895 RepID=A0A103YCN4_CYNCS|nr:Protein kinase, ATP binding site-containing protein [Cynara cardunculus var. scolymus]